jgi:hypothetical protein
MAIIGWLACVAFALYMSAAAGLVALNTLGRYNIGGAINTFGDKVRALLLIAFVSGVWYFVVINAPFTIGMK